MPDNGVRTTDLSETATSDEVLANKDGSLVRQTVPNLASQLTGSGALAEALAAKVDPAVTDGLSVRITAVEDQAFAESPVYEDTAAGLAATSEGERFRVENADPDIAYDIYDHDSGPVATFVTDIPAGSALANKLTTSNALSELAGVAATVRGNIGAAGAADLTDAAGRINYVASSIAGTGDAVTCNLADTSVGGIAVSLTRGMVIHDIPWPGANTGAVTLNVGGTGAVAVQDDQGATLVAGAIASADRVTVFYTGSTWRRVGKGYRRTWDTRLRAQALQSIVTSSPNAITASTADGGITTYTRGQSVFGAIGGGNTGAVTINLNSLGAKSIVEPDGTALAAGRLVAGIDYLIQYNGTSFVLRTPKDLSAQVNAATGDKTRSEIIAPYAPPATHISAAILFAYTPPAGLTWDNDLLPLLVGKFGGSYRVIANPREMVDPRIWTGAVIHVDIATGNDSNSGFGIYYGDFSRSKLTIQAAFTAGNATGAPYRVLVKAGQYAETSFTSNGSVEPTQPLALLAYGGQVRFRTGPWSITWTLDTGTTYVKTLSSVTRIFRTDVLTAEGLYTELTAAADLATCRSTPGTYFKSGSDIYVNIGKAVSATDIAAIRNFHGARFLTHTDDFYIEGFDIEGGITGAFHADPEADRNIVCVDSTFRYSTPSNPTSQQDAFRVRRTNGLVYLRNCDASGGAKDGWNFHGDSYPQMYVLLENCTGYLNGWNSATSCNAFTTHDGVISAVIGSDFGPNSPQGVGTTFHCIEGTLSWALGVTATDEDLDGDGAATAFKCSNDARMWLQETTADASGGASTNYAIEANGGTVLKRDHTSAAGTEETSGSGSIGSF